MHSNCPEFYWIQFSFDLVSISELFYGYVVLFSFVLQFIWNIIFL